jgi:hypothetical protein
MGIFYKDKEVSPLDIGGRAVVAVYYGIKTVWEAIRSCFGKGFWENTKPWDNKDAWENTL